MYDYSAIRPVQIDFWPSGIADDFCANSRISEKRNLISDNPL